MVRQSLDQRLGLLEKLGSRLPAEKVAGRRDIGKAKRGCLTARRLSNGRVCASGKLCKACRSTLAK